MASTDYVARTDDLVVEDLGGELLVYDKRTDIAHCLTSVAAAVWRTSRDGADFEDLERAVRELRAGEDAAEALALIAIRELEEKQLLDGPSARPATVSRRDALRKMAGVGMAAVTAPLVVSAAVTTPEAAAQSPLNCSAVTVRCDGNNALPCCPGLTCTAGSPAGSRSYCSLTTSCTGRGHQPGGQACSTTTRSSCCSGACQTGSNSNLCA